MRRLPYLKWKLFVVVGALVVILVTTLRGLNGSDNERLVQAFYSPIRPPTLYSPIRTPTPYSAPTPRSSPTPQIIRPPLLEIKAEIELRKSIGFRSDIEYVEAVRSSDDVIIEQKYGGVAFTPSEARELEMRIDLEKDGNALLNFFENEPEFQDSFGGIYLEHAAGSEDETVGGELILQLVKGHTMANDILAILPPLQFPKRLRIEMVDFSAEQLKQQFRAISSATSDHPEIRAVSINQKDNRIDVMIIPSVVQKTSGGVVDKSSLPGDLATLLAAPSITVREGKIEKTVEAVRGGDSWSNTSGGSNCTLGFKVKYNDTYSMLTAGHCIEALGMSTGDTVYHNTTQIGTYSGVYKWGAPTNSGTGIDVAILYMNDFGTAYDDINHYDY